MKIDIDAYEQFKKIHPIRTNKITGQRRGVIDKNTNLGKGRGWENELRGQRRGVEG